MQQHIACLSACLSAVRTEIATLSVIGRPLTPDEAARLDALRRTEAHLGDAIASLEAATPPLPAPPPTPAVVPRDGRYVGGDGDRRIEMRIDIAHLGMMSLDLFQLTAGGGRTWLATVRTLPATFLQTSAGEFGVVAEGQDGGVASGTLAVGAVNGDDERASVGLTLDAPVTGIVGHTTQHFAARWEETALRTLGLEVEREVGVNEEPVFQTNTGERMTVTSCLAHAGFARFDMGQPSQIPAPPAPGKWGTAQLHALMVQHAQSSLTGAKGGLHLLRLTESTLNGLLGIMFDSGDTLPRQGSAVFEQEIANFYPNDQLRKSIQTTIHEIGHALNLAHRFERELGRADSLSFMNYDSRYKGGGHESEFWSKFNFSFDHDELAFLRHGPLSALIPGGRDFHTVPYWSEGIGGYVPYMPEEELTFLALELSGPGGTTGPVLFDFLQSVFMRVELTNTGHEPLNLGPHLLDPKSGVLDIVIRRVTGTTPADIGDVWVPMMQRCQASEQAMRENAPGRIMEIVAPGQSIDRNLNLTFGAAGFAFAEPGLYDVQAVVSIHNDVLNRNFIVPSNVVRVRIGAPHSAGEEQDALVMLRADVGTYQALGGSRVLNRAADDLNAVLERRSNGKMTPDDAVCANIIRCQGIDRGRNYLLRARTRFRADKGDRGEAATLLERLDRQTLERYFDVNTVASTISLAQKHRRAASA